MKVFPDESVFNGYKSIEKRGGLQTITTFFQKNSFKCVCNSYFYRTFAIANSRLQN